MPTRYYICVRVSVNWAQFWTNSLMTWKAERVLARHLPSSVKSLSTLAGSLSSFLVRFQLEARNVWDDTIQYQFIIVQPRVNNSASCCLYTIEINVWTRGKWFNTPDSYVGYIINQIWYMSLVLKETGWFRGGWVTLRWIMDVVLRVNSHLRFLGENYCVDYSHNNGFHCTMWVHSHPQLSKLCKNSSHNSSCLKNCRCELTLTV